MDEITLEGLSEEEETILTEALVQAHESTEDTLPSNSNTLLIDEASSRFSSAIWFDEIGKQRVILAGLGGIGSYIAYLLGRLKVNKLILYDDDKVDNTNLSGQLYEVNHIGKYKVTSIASILKRFSEYYSVIGNVDKYSPCSNTTNIMICGFDNMNARRIFYNNWKAHVMRILPPNRDDCLFIDGRLAAEEFQVFCIKGTDSYLMKKYEEEWLFDDSEAEETICSYKQTSFCANMIASVIVNLFVNFVANKCDPLIKRELPFYTSYDAERMLFKTEEV